MKSATQFAVMPPEWAPHKSVWLAWPSDASLWQEDLPAAQDEFVALCTAIADVDPATSRPRGEGLRILTHPDFPAMTELAKRRLAGLGAEFFAIPFGDIWLRDTAPLFVRAPERSQAEALAFRFNGWGQKYVLDYDPEVAERVAAAAGLRSRKLDWISEGGSLEFDGEGTCLTSRQCLLNANRNPSMGQKDIETLLARELGIQKVLWVTEGLINDHTDGHIDTIARFVAPGVVLTTTASSDADPNLAIYQRLQAEILSMSDARGRPLQVGLIPSPGAVYDEEGEWMPASYLNFYIGNTTVVVPTYGAENDAKAVAAIAKYFPDRRTVGCSARAILSGGGAFHCITQQEPL